MPKPSWEQANFGKPWFEGHTVFFAVYTPSGRKKQGTFEVNARRGVVKFHRDRKGRTFRGRQ